MGGILERKEKLVGMAVLSHTMLDLPLDVFFGWVDSFDM
jgi:hypothetical protein